MVQISRVQITSRLRANVFDKEGAFSALMPVLPYVHVALNTDDRLDYDRRDIRRLECGNHYGSSGLSAEGYSPYGAPACLLERLAVIVVLPMEVMHLDTVALLGFVIGYPANPLPIDE
ncbi:unnamed protein product [Brassica rapa subsp. trilocularis]